MGAQLFHAGGRWVGQTDMTDLKRCAFILTPGWIGSTTDATGNTVASMGRLNNSKIWLKKRNHPQHGFPKCAFYLQGQHMEVNKSESIISIQELRFWKGRLKATVFWGVTPRNLVQTNRCSGETCCLYFLTWGWRQQISLELVNLYHITRRHVPVLVEQFPLQPFLQNLTPTVPRPLSSACFSSTLTKHLVSKLTWYSTVTRCYIGHYLLRMGTPVYQTLQNGG